MTDRLLPYSSFKEPSGEKVEVILPRILSEDNMFLQDKESVSQAFVHLGDLIEHKSNYARARIDPVIKH